MAYCRNCGAQIDDEAVICPKCGVSVKTPVQDNGGLGWTVLGCCIPVVGLILFLVWKDTKPKTAKDAGIGALIWLAITIIYYLVVIIAGAGIALSH